MAPAISDEKLAAVRRHGFGVAYRMLGSVSEAEDVAQDAVLRFARSEDAIREPDAWITTAATRLSLDVLRSARVRRESYVGPWLPEPLIEDAAAGPADDVEMADSLSQAFLVMLERLTPIERAAFLLREVFGYEYSEIGEIIGRSDENSRQLVSRAKKHLEACTPRFDPDEALRDELLKRFLAAADEGDVEGLEELLAEDAALYSDGGGKVVAARKPLFGRARIARVFAKLTSKRNRRGPFEMELVKVNGQPGRILRTADGTIWDILSIDVVDGRIQTVRIIRNPDKFSHISDPGSKTTLTSVTEGVVRVDPKKPGLKTVDVPAGKEVEVGNKSMSKIVGIGKAGARKGNNRREAPRARSHRKG